MPTCGKTFNVIVLMIYHSQISRLDKYQECKQKKMTVRSLSPLSMFSIIHPKILQKIEPFISISQIFIWNLELNFNFDRKELEIQPSFVRSLGSGISGSRTKNYYCFF